MEDDRRRDVLKRLSYIEGLVSGGRKMVEEDKYCVDILRQTYAYEKHWKNWRQLSLRGICVHAYQKGLKVFVKRRSFRN